MRTYYHLEGVKVSLALVPCSDETLTMVYITIFFYIIPIKEHEQGNHRGKEEPTATLLARIVSMCGYPIA